MAGSVADSVTDSAVANSVHQAEVTDLAKDSAEVTDLVAG